MKYILHSDFGLILFEDHILHKDMANWFGNRAVSAGFVRQANAGLECYGESQSLNLKASDRDTQRLNAFLREAK